MLPSDVLEHSIMNPNPNRQPGRVARQQTRQITHPAFLLSFSLSLTLSLTHTHKHTHYVLSEGSQEVSGAEARFCLICLSDRQEQRQTKIIVLFGGWGGGYVCAALTGRVLPYQNGYLSQSVGADTPIAARDE